MSQRRFKIPLRRWRGLTLVEILVALVVLGVIAAVAAPSLADMMERRRVVAAAGELVSLFNYAKSEANSLGDRLTMHLETPTDQTSCARLTTWGTFDHCSCAFSGTDVCSIGSAKTVREFVLPKSTGVSFSASAVWGPAGAQLLFVRNQHDIGVQNVQLTVTGRRTGAQLRVEYNNAGRVRTCSPNGSIGGFPTCG